MKIRHSSGARTAWERWCTRAGAGARGEGVEGVRTTGAGAAAAGAATLGAAFVVTFFAAALAICNLKTKLRESARGAARKERER